MDKRFLSFLAVIVLVFVGLLFIGKKDAKEPASTNTASATNHVRGSGSKQVTLIEYGDYQCPACLTYYPIIEALVEKYKNDITFQFSNFPLDSIHPNGRAAARTAEAADMQGKFWDMYDLLYQNQNQWASASNPQPLFESYASDLKLNLDQFRKDRSSASVNSRINADITQGQKIKAVSTPTFVLNGRKLVDNPPANIDSFSKLIDDEIAKQKTTGS